MRSPQTTVEINKPHTPLEAVDAPSRTPKSLKSNPNSSMNSEKDACDGECVEHITRPRWAQTSTKEVSACQNWRALLRPPDVSGRVNPTLRSQLSRLGLVQYERDRHHLSREEALWGARGSLNPCLQQSVCLGGGCPSAKKQRPTCTGETNRDRSSVQAIQTQVPYRHRIEPFQHTTHGLTATKTGMSLS